MEHCAKQLNMQASQHTGNIYTNWPFRAMCQELFQMIEILQTTLLPQCN